MLAAGHFPRRWLIGDAAEVRQRGNEFGAVTGRPRRCGWLDLPVLKYAKMLNGIDSLVVTKLDVFDAQAEIQVCTGYRYKGEILAEMPPDVETLAQIEPEYKTLPGWGKPTPGIRDVKDLPIAAREYLNFISDALEIEIGMISTGPGTRCHHCPARHETRLLALPAMLSVEAARAEGHRSVRARTEDLSHRNHFFRRGSRDCAGPLSGRKYFADRNYPPFNRSMRDGYALRAADAAKPGARLRLIGESRAGVGFQRHGRPGNCVHIMTGAAVPRGADTVVMQEHTRIEDEPFVLRTQPSAGRNYVLAGSEARVGEVDCRKGDRLSYPELAMAAEVGRVKNFCDRRPRVAILSSGDELVALKQPGPISDSQLQQHFSCGAGFPGGWRAVILGIAPDEFRSCVNSSRRNSCDMSVLSGGVSVGKYDLVEQVLQEFGAEFFFDSRGDSSGQACGFWMVS